MNSTELLVESAGRDTLEQRLKREAAFFDSQTYSTDTIPHDVIRRYVECRQPYLTAEYPFWVLEDLRGKHVLDVGCGDGSNALLLALKGAASVTGIDLSSRAIDAARVRASKHGLTERMRFVCGPLETCLPRGRRFDVITGFRVLHHVIPTLDDILWQMKGVAAPGARLLFVEPVSNSRLLRSIRLALPVPLSGTPDERPLEPAEIDVVLRHLDRPSVRYFDAMARIPTLVLNRVYRERKEPTLLWNLYQATCRADAVLLNRLHLHQFASVVVISGGLKKN